MSFIPCDGERSLSVGYEFTAGISDMTSGHGRARLSGTWLVFHFQVSCFAPLVQRRRVREEPPKEKLPRLKPGNP